jgi:hypothetical protein
LSKNKIISFASWQSVNYAAESVLHSALCVAALFCRDCSRHEIRRLLLVCHCDSLLASESEKDLYQLEPELVSEALLSVLLFLLSFGTVAQALSKLWSSSRISIAVGVSWSCLDNTMAITQMKGQKSKETNQYVDHNRKQQQQQQRDPSSSSDTDKRTGNKQSLRIRSREPQLSAPGFADPEASRRGRISCHRIHHNSRRNGGSSFFIFQQPTGHTQRQLQCRCGYPNRDWREQQVHWKNCQQQQVSDKKRTLELGGSGETASSSAAAAAVSARLSCC